MKHREVSIRKYCSTGNLQVWTPPLNHKMFSESWRSWQRDNRQWKWGYWEQVKQILWDAGTEGTYSSDVGAEMEKRTMQKHKSGLKHLVSPCPTSYLKAVSWRTSRNTKELKRNLHSGLLKYLCCDQHIRRYKILKFQGYKTWYTKGGSTLNSSSFMWNINLLMKLWKSCLFEKAEANRSAGY